jgi:hypothetical protein
MSANEKKAYSYRSTPATMEGVTRFRPINVDAILTNALIQREYELTCKQ